MKRNDKRIGLQQLVDGLLFSLQAEGKAAGTIEYYRDLLQPFLSYARSKDWVNGASSLDAHRLREFAGDRRQKVKAKKTACLFVTKTRLIRPTVRACYVVQTTGGQITQIGFLSPLTDLSTPPENLLVPQSPLQ